MKLAYSTTKHSSGGNYVRKKAFAFVGFGKYLL